MRILYVEDEQEIADTISEILSAEGYICTHVIDGDSGWQMWQIEEFDLLLTDLNLPNMTGLELIQKARELKPSAKIVGISGYIEPEEVERIKLLGADVILLKPMTPRQLLSAIKGLD
ncbi:MAG: response regulator [Pseudanabaenaceae cyanobacterium]